MRNPMHSRVRPILAALLGPLLAAACSHGAASSSSTASAGSASTGGAQDAGPCGTLPAAQALFTTRCAGSSCHGSGPSAQFPPLAEGNPSAWVGLASHADPSAQLVVPGNPEQSFLYKKLSGTQGPTGGALMPLGAATPIMQASAIHDWIAAGAPTSCADADAGAPPSVDPNTLDQSQLFTCPANSTPASSPGRIRRIDSPEWTYSLPQPLNGFNNGIPGGSKAYLNPFLALATEPYSTYSAGVSVDTPTLDLYFQVLPEAPLSWTALDPATAGGTVLGKRLTGIDTAKDLDCIYNDVAPSATCIDTFATRFLQLGVLGRTPSADDIADLEALLTTTIAGENGDITQRPTTLAVVGQAAWLTSAALFRTELGVAGSDPTHRNKLTNEELALAIGGMLSFHRPGAPMVYQAVPPDPDDPCHGWLQKIAAAAADGTIQDPATIKSLITAYAGGMDPGGVPYSCMLGTSTISGTTPRRRDLAFETSTSATAARGAYWLAPRVADFFRQWLGYGNANAVFKDTPGATSQYATSNSLYDWTSGSFGDLQSQYHGPEASLVGQMDDTVARAVIEAAQNKIDVFKNLMTTRTFRVPSDRGDSNSAVCAQASDCTDPNYATCALTLTCGAGYGCETAADCPTGNTCTKSALCPSGNACTSPEGVCVNSSGGFTAWAARAYNLEGIAGTDAARWATMPANERSGVLTHPAWLGAHGDNFQDDPTLVHRGKWVRQNLFCETVPGLELVMVAARVGPGAPTLSARDRLEAATTPNATCMGCHHLMNPLGFPFEMYNHAGFLRVYDKFEEDGKTPHPPNAVSFITDSPDPAINGAVQNAIDFTEKLGSSPYARRCFIRQAFRYFMGRDETIADQCTLTAMETALDGGSFFDMLGVLASSDTVVYRSGGTP